MECSQTITQTVDLQPLTCRASNAVYQKYLQKQFGIGTCENNLSNEEIEDAFENIDLLKYISCHEVECCDKNTLIENLK